MVAEIAVRFILALLSLLLASCVTPDTTLVNDQGSRVECSARGYGLIGAAVAVSAHDDCVSRNVGQGYRVEATTADPDTPTRTRDNTRRNRRTTSTGVQQLGPDTYLIARSRDRGGLVAAEAAALGEANGHCRERNTELLVLTREPGRGGSFTLTFRCLRIGDPELRRPAVEATPNRIIEQRQR
jgi:hypothetical protein